MEPTGGPPGEQRGRCWRRQRQPLAAGEGSLGGRICPAPPVDRRKLPPEGKAEPAVQATLGAQLNEARQACAPLGGRAGAPSGWWYRHMGWGTARLLQRSPWQARSFRVGLWSARCLVPCLPYGLADCRDATVQGQAFASTAPAQRVPADAAAASRLRIGLSGCGASARLRTHGLPSVTIKKRHLVWSLQSDGTPASLGLSNGQGEWWCRRASRCQAPVPDLQDEKFLPKSRPAAGPHLLSLCTCRFITKVAGLQRESCAWQVDDIMLY